METLHHLKRAASGIPTLRNDLKVSTVALPVFVQTNKASRFQVSAFGGAKIRRIANIRRIVLLSCAALLILWIKPVAATELVYTPVNPVFGGNPLNGSVLLNAAQAQNKTKDPQDALSKELNNSPLQQFNDTLQRSVLSRLAAGATSQVLNSSGRLVPGRVETGNFLISITDQGNGVLLVTTTDKLSGNATSFQVSQ